MTNVNRPGKVRYRPLNVRTWKEGWIESSPIPLVGIFALITAGLLVLYEFLFLTYQDRDFRDTLFDQRITNSARNLYHQNFIKATFCCNTDLSETGLTVTNMSCNENVSAVQAQLYGSDVVNSTCPPIIFAFCNFLQYPEYCKEVKRTLFELSWLDPDTGSYTNCVEGGRFRVGMAPQFGPLNLTVVDPSSQETSGVGSAATGLISSTANASGIATEDDVIAWAAYAKDIAESGSLGSMYEQVLPYLSDTGEAYSILTSDTVAYTLGNTPTTDVVPVTFALFYNMDLVDEFSADNVSSINATKIEALMDQAVSIETDPLGLYVQPSQSLTSVTIGGVAGALTPVCTGPYGGLKGVDPWPSGIWPYPGMSKRCPDTDLSLSCNVQGEVYIPFPDFSFAALPSLRVLVQVGDDGDGVWAPLYKVEAVTAAAQVAADEVASPVVDDSRISYDADGAAGIATVRIGRLKGINLNVGLSPLRDGCAGWRLSPVAGRPLRQMPRSYDGEQYELSRTFEYAWIQTYTGGIDGIPNISFSDESLSVFVSVSDVSAPLPLELPEYSGVTYIFAAFPFAFVWLVCTGVTILFIPVLIYWNIHARTGLPFFWYRWTRRHRGW